MSVNNYNVEWDCVIVMLRWVCWCEQVCEVFGLEALAQDINMRQYKLTVHEEYDPSRLYTGEIARLNSLKVIIKLLTL